MLRQETWSLLSPMTSKAVLVYRQVPLPLLQQSRPRAQAMKEENHPLGPVMFTHRVPMTIHSIYQTDVFRATRRPLAISKKLSSHQAKVWKSVFRVPHVDQSSHIVAVRT